MPSVAWRVMLVEQDRQRLEYDEAEPPFEVFQLAVDGK